MNKIASYLVSALLLLNIAAESALAQEKYFFAFLNSNPNKPEFTKEEDQKIQAAHMANMGKLAAKGILLGAGPLEGGGGIFVMTGKSMEEVNNYMQTDPSIKAKRHITELFPFDLHIGEIYKLKVDEPYTMVNYQFVRFEVANKNVNKKTLNQIEESHKNYIRNHPDVQKVIASGWFGAEAGGVLFLNVATKGDAEAFLKNHPLTDDENFAANIRKIYIAREVFEGKK